MKILILALLVLAGGYLYPSLNEDTSSNCQAVESRLLTYTEIPLLRKLSGLSQGEVGKELAKQKFPDLPPQAACAAVYWDLLINKDKHKKSVKEFVGS
jgi:hypothetical protein